MNGPAGGFCGGNFVEDFGMVAGEKCWAVDDHIDLVCAIGDCAADFLEPGAQRILAARESRGDRGDFYGRVWAEKSSRVANHIRIDADSGARRSEERRVGKEC